MNNRRFRMSRRTAGWLVAVLAVVVVVHFAYGGLPTALTRAVTGHPVIQVSLRGEITRLSPNDLTVTLEDPHGNLTSVTRQVVLTSHTRFVSPGQPSVVGAQGYQYLKSGYRVLIRGASIGQNQLEAQLVAVSFPPITGTVDRVQNSVLTLSVPGQSHKAHVSLTSHTAFFVPNGDWHQLATGAPVRVWVIPTSQNGSGLTAITVMVVKLPQTGS